MEVFYLPSYSPELNPEERLNADLKHVIGRKMPMRTKAKLRAAAEDHMAVVACEPERVKAYFQDPQGQICRMNLFVGRINKRQVGNELHDTPQCGQHRQPR